MGYSVTLTVNDEGDDGDLFYLSNAHDYMAGRIKVYENGAPVHTLDTPAIPTEPNVAPSMGPASSPTRMPTPPPPTPKPTPPPSPSPGNPTASPAPAPTAAPIAAPTMAPVAAPTPLPSVAAADTIAAASSSGSGGSGTMTSTAKSNIVATVCVVAAVLIGGAFVAWRRSAQAAAKDPAPALAVQLDAVETDDKAVRSGSQPPPSSCNHCHLQHYEEEILLNPRRRHDLHKAPASSVVAYAPEGSSNQSTKPSSTREKENAPAVTTASRVAPLTPRRRKDSDETPSARSWARIARPAGVAASGASTASQLTAARPARRPRGTPPRRLY